ncbi:hypothetical protein, partial [Mesorhizobium sp. M1403]|uniref:hypothetical protein n=1 Tax=Mesorhizobium sp. M1403 TaxID=2957097 RepID=UPI003338AF92
GRKSKHQGGQNWTPIPRLMGSILHADSHLTRLLTDKIDTIDPGFGIELMRLAATAAEDA